MAKPERHVVVCTNSRPPGHPRGSCGAVGSNEVLGSFQKEFEIKNLFGRFLLTGSTCLGPCSFGPIVVIYPEGVWYSKVSVDDIPEIVEKHIMNGQPVERLIMPEAAWG